VLSLLENESFDEKIEYRNEVKVRREADVPSSHNKGMKERN
jgi:hypothetical protein